MKKIYKILIIDDEKLIREPIASELKMNNFTVFEASDGEQGIESALKNKPDLVLLDIVMPKKNGAEVIEKLRAESWGENLPIIIFTSSEVTNEMLRNIEKYSPSYYLVKNQLNLFEVVDKVKETLRIN